MCIRDRAGLLERNKEGSWVFVRFASGEQAERVAALLDLESEPAVDMARLEEVRQERVRAAEDYFSAHADDWDRLRKLHVADSEVEARILALLSGRPIGRLLDIGTGTGRMLELLGPQAAEAVGIDRSADMLRAARGKLEAAGLGNCPVRQGDMQALPSPEGAADTVVLHQVLHFAERPGAAVREAARVLAPGGRLLIADFAPHEREELRKEHAHMRLGFDEELVCTWLKQAGLTPYEPEHLEGDLTVTIWTADKPGGEARQVA